MGGMTDLSNVTGTSRIYGLTTVNKDESHTAPSDTSKEGGRPVETNQGRTHSSLSSTKERHKPML